MDTYRLGQILAHEDGSIYVVHEIHDTHMFLRIVFEAHPLFANDTQHRATFGGDLLAHCHEIGEVEP